MSFEYEVDYTDSQGLDKLANQCIKLSLDFKQAREIVAESRFKIDIALAKMYRDHPDKRKMAKDKAVLFLLFDDKSIQEAYYNEIKYEQEYKGLEMVIQAIDGKIGLARSLIKNTPQG